MYKYFKRHSNPLKGRSLEGRSLGKEAVSRLFVNKAAVSSMVILAVIFTLSLLGPMVLPNHIDVNSWSEILKGEFGRTHSASEFGQQVF